MRSRKAILGVSGALCLVVVLVALWTLYRSHVFDAKNCSRFWVVVPSGLRLATGNLVYYAGVMVGTVAETTIVQMDREGPGQVRAQILIDYPGLHIRRADSFEVRVEEILGDSCVMIMPSHTTSPVLKQDEEVVGRPARNGQAVKLEAILKTVGEAMREAKRDTSESSAELNLEPTQ